MPERKYTVPQCTSIGKVCDGEEGMMIPNRNYIKYFPDADMPEYLPESTRSGCLKIGSYLVIRKVIEHYGFESELQSLLGKDAGLFLDLAAYVFRMTGTASGITERRSTFPTIRPTSIARPET